VESVAAIAQTLMKTPRPTRNASLGTVVGVVVTGCTTSVTWFPHIHVQVVEVGSHRGWLSRPVQLVCAHCCLKASHSACALVVSVGVDTVVVNVTGGRVFVLKTVVRTVTEATEVAVTVFVTVEVACVLLELLEGGGGG